MKQIVLMSLCALALGACTVPQPQPNAERVDSSGTYYQDAVPSHPVNDSWRNSTDNASSDRQSGRNPVGSTPDSNPY